MASEEHFELHSELIERGFAWQVATFATIGIAATTALAIYSETDVLTFRFFEVATTKLNWAFVPAVAFIVDWSRKMFERRSDIRAAARREAVEKARQKGLKEGLKQGIEQGRIAGIEEAERKAEDRLRSRLDKFGIEIPPEFADQIFNHKNGQDS